VEALTANDIKSVFRPFSGSELALPDLEPIDWGILDYLGWVHPSGSTAFVVMPVFGELRSLRLRRAASNNTRPRTRMCSWCHHVYRSRGTALFSVYVAGSDGRRSIGNHVCRNLDCSLRIRNLVSDPPTYLPETLHIASKIRRLENSVLTFMSRANVLA
jgi:hypothetical protein